MTPPLTYTATVQPNGDVTIVLQSFTHDRGLGAAILFEASNGVKIRSWVAPEWFPKVNELYVQGDVQRRDDDEIHIPAADWQRVKQALDEYGAVQTNAETRHRVTRAEALEISQQTIETAERERSQTAAEAKKPPYRVVEDSFAYGIHGGEGCVAALSKKKGWTKAQADELCARFIEKADAERKATEVRVGEHGDARKFLYIGDRKSGFYCASILPGSDSGLTADQADQLAAATAEALRGILRGEGAK